MTPEPLRGTVCGPEHVIFTAERLAEVRGCAPGEERAALLRRLLENARSLLDREPTAWQQQAARQFYADAFATLGGAAPAAADGQ